MERYLSRLFHPDAVRAFSGTAGLLLRKAAALFAGLVLCNAAAASPVAVVIPLNGAVGPASADFVVRALARAAEVRAQLAILEIDTPGGLDQSMRSIIKAILASPVPVAAFIAPGGARAASAGTYIVYASHIAAMAPGTNLGAATPIRISAGGSAEPEPDQAKKDAGASASAGVNAASTETNKQVQDAAAYIRGLAQLRGRNVQWAERAVREAVSLSASEALAQNVIDLNASDVPDLLAKLNGRHVQTITGDHVLATSGAVVVTIQPDWRSRFLATITDPIVALILITIGLYGLFFEFANPGLALPGVAGAISLMLGLFALQLLPVDFAGLGLILLGIAFLVAEIFLPTFGTLGFGGIVAFAMGALMLFRTDTPGYGIPVALVVGLTIATALFVFVVSSVALRARRRPVVSGAEAMLGSIGEMLEDVPPSDSGWARVHGERWRVCCHETPALLARGERVRVLGRHGLMLSVVRLDEIEQGEK
ncbi:nodulation protein NfeD [Caballeronia mineralivorans]|uniref:NfeD family protein n=1 Tax=Caballeronia mineralivorans TaxID=2010198 RepID=UPI0023EF86D8|nr:nodulation protein NfeD [Caballeronia mineralivorans]MDB5782330.1 nodulation competitiveness protein nfeD [Caballeronia mineralivorans]